MIKLKKSIKTVNQTYRYLGDKLTDESLKDKECIAVKRQGKCIRAKSKMLVEFTTGKQVVLARRLRKMNTKENIRKYCISNPNKFNRLRYSWIIGIINRNGVAESQCFYFEEASTHEDLWPLVHEKRWKWDYDHGVTVSIYGGTFKQGDGDIIRNHLRREYGIRFYENGHHDIIYFMNRMNK